MGMVVAIRSLIFPNYGVRVWVLNNLILPPPTKTSVWSVIQKSDVRISRVRKLKDHTWNKLFTLFDAHLISGSFTPSPICIPIGFDTSCNFICILITEESQWSFLIRRFKFDNFLISFLAFRKLFSCNNENFRLFCWIVTYLMIFKVQLNWGLWSYRNRTLIINRVFCSVKFYFIILRCWL